MSRERFARQENRVLIVTTCGDSGIAAGMGGTGNVLEKSSGLTNGQLREWRVRVRTSCVVECVRLSIARGSDEWWGNAGL